MEQTIVRGKVSGMDLKRSGEYCRIEMRISDTAVDIERATVMVTVRSDVVPMWAELWQRNVTLTLTSE